MKLFRSTSNRVIVSALAFAVLFNGSIFVTKADLEQRTHQGLASIMQTLLQTTDEALLLWLDNELGTLQNWVSYYRPFKTMVADLTPLKEDAVALAASDLAQRMAASIDVLMNNKGYLNYYLLADDFTVLATSSSTESRLATKSLSALFSDPRTQSKLAAGEAVFVNHLVDDGEDRHISELFIAQAVTNGDKRREGYFLFQLNPAKQFSKMLQLGRFGETGETYTFNYSGSLLSESRFTSVTSEAYGAVPSNSLVLNSNGGRIKGVPLAQIHSGNWFGSQTEAYSNYRGVAVVGAWQWLDEFNFGVVTEIDHAEAFNNHNKTIFALSASQLLTNLLLLATTLMNLRRHKRMRRFALTDPMTKIGNRKFLENELERILNEARRSGLPVSVMMLDIDKFKPYNDEFGHPQGDVALRKVAQAINDAVPRTTDVVARYGGEEFCVVLPFSDHQQADVVAERLLSAVNDLKLEPSSKAHHRYVTVSVGYTSVVVDAESSGEQCLQMADKALYQAKVELGNVAVAYQAESEQRRAS